MSIDFKLQKFPKQSSRWLALVWSVVLSPSLMAQQSLPLDQNRRLEAAIALDAMSRLAVENDRIVNVFGDEGLFVTQTEERTGQVFIKPTVENGEQPLSVTLMTENGVTQDLLLRPKAQPAATVILKNPLAVGLKEGGGPVSSAGLLSSEPHSLQSQWVNLIKLAVLRQLPQTEAAPRSRSAPPNAAIAYEGAYQTSVGIVSRWSLKNKSVAPIELSEPMFYKQGDLAMHLSKARLAPQEKTWLMVLEAHQ